MNDKSRQLKLTGRLKVPNVVNVCGFLISPFRATTEEAHDVSLRSGSGSQLLSFVL